MINQYIGQGVIELTEEELDKIPGLVGYQLDGATEQKSIIKFKFMDMYGHWAVVNIVMTDEGVNMLCSRIKIKDK